jgi:hypothetical protein
MTEAFNEDDHAYSPPPTEADWEEFIKRSDARSAKYAELLETLIDHPDCDQIIQEEMGWDRDDADGDSCREVTDWTPDEVFDSAFESDDTPSMLEKLDDDDDDPLSFEESPVYHKALEWGLRLHKELQAYLPEVGEMDPEDPLYLAFCECVVVPAKIAGSHAMSEDDDSLGGSIVYTKRALKAATATLSALEELQHQQALEADKLVAWIAETREVCQAIKQQIEEYRSRVWWD